MSLIEVRGLRVAVDGNDLWRAEANVGKPAMRAAIQTAAAVTIRRLATRGAFSIAKFLELHENGWCDALIADQLDVSKERIQKTRKNLGIRANRCHNVGGRRN